MVTQDYVYYMTNNAILIGAEFDKIVSILTVTAVLAIAIARARRLLEDQGVNYTYIDLDRPENQRLLPLLQAKLDQRTVPFVFVRGRFVGGMTELDVAVRMGQLNDSPADRVEVLTAPAEQPTRPPKALEMQATLEGTSDRKRPNRPETHKPAPMMKLMDLGLEVEAEAAGEPATMELLNSIAYDQDASIEHLLAGAALMEGLTFERATDIRFKVCTGHCQRWGALPRLLHLVSLLQAGGADRKANFDIEPVECLDRCDRAPAVIVHTPDGVAALDGVTDADLTAAVEQLCEG